MTTFRWLHLTDLHFRMNGQGHLWPNFEAQLLKDLYESFQHTGAWDVVLFTGDLVQCGSPEEFAALEVMLQKMWAKFKKWDSDFQPKLFAVPGNHDLVRPTKSSATKVLTSPLWSDLDTQKSFWEDKESEYLAVVTQAFSPYQTWWSTTQIPKLDTLQAGLLPGDASASFVTADGRLKIGLVGLNSAYLQLDGGDFSGKLHVDVRQLNAACANHAPDWLSKHDLAFLLTHHPFDWLSEEAQQHFNAEIYIPERFAAHLFGHMHKNSTTDLAQGGSQARRFIQGCSMFGLEYFGKEQQRAHGYSIGELQLADDEISMRHWPRRTERKQSGELGFVNDTSFHLERGGETKAIRIKQLEKKSPLNPANPAAQPHSPVNTEASSSANRPKYDLNNPSFNVPYRQKGKQMVGRAAALELVRKQLVAGKQTAIGQTAAFQGVGGLGKTQLAVEYAYAYRDEYPNGVIWLTADQEIDGQLCEISDEAKWIAPETEPKLKLELAIQRLRSFSDCLIVFDNLEDMAAIEPYLPETKATPHLLVTSRQEQIDFSYVPLDFLSTDDSLQLLLQESQRSNINNTPEEYTAAQQITEKLGGLPLALELAGAYLARRPLSFVDYQQLLESNLKKALPSRLSSLTKHSADLYSTLEISADVFGEAPLLGDILNLLAWSAAAPMEVDLISTLLNLKEDQKADLTNALALGLSLRILQKIDHSERYRIHRLVREVRREQVPISNHAQLAAQICERIGDWFYAIREDFYQLTRFEQEIQHLKEWHNHSLNFATQQACRLMWLQAFPAYHRASGHEVKKYADQALVEYKNYQCTDQELFFDIQSARVFAGNVLGDYQTALAIGLDTVYIDQLATYTPSASLATLLSNIASSYGNLNKFDLAIKLGDQILAMWKCLFGDKHPNIASTLNNIAAYKDDLGKTQEALNLANKALKMRQSLFGDYHPDIANSHHNIASYYLKQRNIKKAQEHAKLAFEIHKQVFGIKHKYTQETLTLLRETQGQRSSSGKKRK